MKYQAYTPPYGKLEDLNSSRLILDSVGEELLTYIVKDFLDTLKTSAVVYERNGDCALGIFSCGWCRFLDNASRNLCQTNDKRKAVLSGKWLCHESCWTDISKVCIESGEPFDGNCHGGLQIYAIPIWVRGEVVGAINFGYGEPPKEALLLQQIAEKYQVTLQELQQHARDYESQPESVVKALKRTLSTSARLIGNIIERKQVERELKEHKFSLGERFRSAFEYSGIGMSIVSLQGDFLQVNPALCEILGYTEAELLKLKFQDVTALEDLEPDLKNLQDLLAGMKDYYQLEKKYIHKQGHKVSVLINVSVVKDNKGSPLYVVGQVQDITERKKFEKEMIKYERLNVVGQMAAGIGHEIRNPMTAVRGFLQLLEKKEEFKASKNIFNLMLNELDRANSIISEFLSLAHNRPVELRRQNLNDIITTLSPLVIADAIKNGKYVEIEMGDLSEINLNEKEIRQVILNLVRNGIEAMPEGETLIIRTYAKDNEVILEIEDRGPGVPEEVIANLGTPFVTTKDHGTGLGLSICYSIAKHHEATIDFDTSSTGATFRVRFKK